MKGSVVCSAVLLFVLLVPAAIVSARHITRRHSRHGHQAHHHPTLPATGDGVKLKPGVYMADKRPLKHRKADPLQIAGSSLPDCSHACGSCSPCRLVMVSFVCALLAEAETCPMAYKCMCNNKSYPVP